MSDNFITILNYWMEYDKIALTLLSKDGIIYFSKDGKYLINEFVNPEKDIGHIYALGLCNRKLSGLRNAISKLSNELQVIENTLTILHRLEQLNEKLHFLDEIKDTILL